MLWPYTEIFGDRCGDAELSVLKLEVRNQFDVGNELEFDHEAVLRAEL